MQIVKTSQSKPATTRPALNGLLGQQQVPQPYGRDTFLSGLPRQQNSRVRARVRSIPKASISDIDPLVFSAAALGVGGLVAALARTTSQLNALKAQWGTSANGHKTQHVVPEDKKSNWSELVKVAGPIVALIIFSLNLNQQIGALGARQDAFKDSLGLIRGDMKEGFASVQKRLDGLDSKITDLGKEAATEKGIKIGQRRSTSDPSG